MMKKRILALGFGVLFFGSIATSTFAAVVEHQTTITIVDNDKKAKKAKKTKKSDSKECATTKTECTSSHKSSCDEKKNGDKK